ncbi:hypothetical protein [Hahella sp. HN01]|uniref:hypothetical protein n=1 Tax=Hahella sp. HN01 TaxID=2847262 RepID=UPI001C1ECD25|nr:hypothetical protein [Hahella sp. HN01]MBU6956033.1 hypothetical protein [Hahella sp. HN01]
MQLDQFNKTLSWLDRLEIDSFDRDCNLTVKITAEGGPGENVNAFVTFKSVCYLNISTVILFSEHPRLVICDIEKSKVLLPEEEFDDIYLLETKESNLTTFQLYDNMKPLSYCIVCYGAEFYQKPADWKAY